MRYLEVFFRISAPQECYQDVCDVLAAMAGETGFETFRQEHEGLTGYVQQDLFSANQLDQVISQLPFPGVSVTYQVKEADHRDWNEQWETEGFQPIAIGGQLLIHDGRHLPHPISDDQLMVEIDAKLAFGTGNHQTTRLMAGELMDMSLEGNSVLDCGTGTGILAIVALLRGAQSAVGYDIDEWSVDNARHNAIINGVEQRFTSILGDSIVIESLHEHFDLIMANINRNILLNDMPRFRKAMKPHARLLISGFYKEDVPQLIAKAETLGLTCEKELQEEDWSCLNLILK
ncbi:MAG: 50S ribosomal protein L11 methyltransferase [Prevotella sp.]|nr:50S ribosomal protein L11 methyltransferase [Prevotella sp.]